MSQQENRAQIRAFIAIPLPEVLTAELEKVQGRLRAATAEVDASAVRWVRPQQFHLTLKFLGDVASERIPDMASAIETACQGINPFQLQLEEAGCFPNARKPRVVWAGINGEVEALKRLQERIEREIEPFCQHEESRAFQPHLTLGRMQTRDAGVARYIGNIVAAAQIGVVGAWTARSVVLMQSQLSPRGSTYTELAVSHLQAADHTV